MKRIFKISAYIGAVLILLGITSCQKEKLDTAQYDDTAVKLASFGPNPVMRGAQLRFFGSNLDKITSVEVPGIPVITEIEVVAKGKLSEIRVTVPTEGPEIGFVTLTASTGEKFKTVSQLTYSEPIVFEDFQVESPAYSGDVITITGDYINLVKTVEFEGGAKVEIDQATVSRHSGTVTIPYNALTGKIILSDGGSVENLFYSEKDLVMGDPTVNKNEPATAKAGDSLSFTGKHLDMIESVHVGDVEVDEFEMGMDGSYLSFILPAAAADGDVVFTSFAGKEFTAGTLKTVAPVVTSIAPTTVKAGETLTFTGTNLDLVVSASFDGAPLVECEYNDGVVTVVVPAEAKEGTVNLVAANGAMAPADFTLVKPVISNINPLEIFAGDEITLTGTDFDLVTNVQLAGKDAEFVVSNDGKSIVIKTAVTAVSGKIKLQLANTTEIESDSDITVNYHSKVIVTEINQAQNIGQPVSIKGTNLKLVESIYIGDVKVTDYELRTDEQIVFNMPWNVAGSYPVNFHLYDGDVEQQPNPIEVLLELEITNIFTGVEDLGTWSTQPYFGADGMLEGKAKVGDKIRVQYAPHEGHDDYQIQLWYGHWDSQIVEITSTSVPYTGFYDIAVTADNIGLLTTPQGWGGVILAQGQYAYITKVDLIHEIPQAKAIWTGTHSAGGWAAGMADLAWGGYDWSTVTAGTKLIVNFTVDPAKTYDCQIRFGNGSWSALPGTKNLPGADTDGNIMMADDATTYSFTLTQEMIDEMVNNGGLVICGAWFILTEVALL